MKRRKFIASSATILGAALTSDIRTYALQGHARVYPAVDNESRDNPFQLTSRYSDEALHAEFTSSDPKVVPQPSSLMYLYYDRKTQSFKDPREVVPDLTSGKYELNVELYAFNISQESQGKLNQINQKHDLQLTLNVTAPQSADENDTLSWVFMNAIDIFGTKTNVQDRLTKFLDNNKPTAALKPISKIVIPEGGVELQVVTLGQRKEGFWKSFFAIVTKLSSAPVFAALGLPALVPEALQFVNSSLGQLSKNEPLVPIWQTQRLPFGILKDSDADYKLKSGPWIIVDRKYALDTKMLQDHKIDFEGQSFTLTRANNQPVDANYLSVRFNVAQAKTGA